MRFEIRAGGIFVILIGLVVLSGAVFFLGVMAGNEIARQNTPDQSQVSSMFPLPSPPAVANAMTRFESAKSWFDPNPNSAVVPSRCSLARSAARS